MKIAFINSVVDFGSTGKIVRSLANALKEEGHEVLICYGRNYRGSDADTFYFGSDLDMKIHGVMTRLFGRHGLHSRKQTKLLIDKLDSYNPDVIHLHNIHGYYLNYPMLFEYLKKANIKVLWTLHDAWSFSGSSAYFDYHGCKVWEDGCVVCNSTQDYPEVKGLSRQKKNFSLKKKCFSGLNDLTIITPSQWLNCLASKTFLSQYPIITIHNGIDTGIFKPITTPSTNSFKILGVANIWEKRKGLDDFIKLRSLLDVRYEITLVGLSSAQIKDLPQGIKGIERTSSVEELVMLYSNANVYVNPTYEDNYPTTNLESLACHTAVVAYDTGGNREAGVYPYVRVCEKGDVQALKMQIQAIEEEPVDFGGFDQSHIENSTFVAKMLEVYKEKLNV